MYFFLRKYEYPYFPLFFFGLCQVTLFLHPHLHRRRRRRRLRCTFPVSEYNIVFSSNLALRSKPSLSEPHLTPIVPQFHSFNSYLPI
jgi:hypothetical protein